MQSNGSILTCGLAMVLSHGVSAGVGHEGRGGEALTVYSSLPLQGDSQPQSEDIERAIQLALDEHGGRAGEVPIRYVSLDDAREDTGSADPEQIAANAERAAGDATAIAYIGEFNSFASKVSIPILNEAGVLQISPSNTEVGLTRGSGAAPGEPDIYYPTGERTFGRVVPADHIQAAAIATLMEEKGCVNAYIAEDDGSPYGASIAGLVDATAEAHGLEIVAHTTTAETDLATIADDVAASGADCFFFAGLTRDGAADLFADVAALDSDIVLFGPDSLAERAFTDHVAPEFEARVFITNPTLPADEYPAAAQDFFDSFAATYGHEPEPYAIYGYEAMNVALLAIEAAGDDATPDAAGRAAVVAQFFGIEDRESVLGTYSIDDSGDTTLAEYGGYTVRDGELAFDRVISATGVLPPGASQPTTTAVEITTPFPEGVYETTPSAEAWIAAGFPEEAGLKHRISFRSGRFEDRCVQKDGTEETCWAGTYRDVGDHEIELGDAGFSIRLRWRLEGDTLTFEMDPDEGEEGDRIVFTSAPWTRVDE